MWLRISSEGLCKQVVPVCDKLAPARPAHGRYLATRWKTHIVDPDRQRYWLKRLLVIMVLTGDNGLLGSIWLLAHCPKFTSIALVQLGWGFLKGPVFHWLGDPELIDWSLLFLWLVHVHSSILWQRINKISPSPNLSGCVNSLLAQWWVHFFGQPPVLLFYKSPKKDI